MIIFKSRHIVSKSHKSLVNINTCFFFQKQQAKLCNSRKQLVKITKPAYGSHVCVIWSCCHTGTEIFITMYLVFWLFTSSVLSNFNIHKNRNRQNTFSGVLAFNKTYTLGWPINYQSRFPLQIMNRCGSAWVTVLRLKSSLIASCTCNLLMYTMNYYLLHLGDLWIWFSILQFLIWVFESSIQLHSTKWLFVQVVAQFDRLATSAETTVLLHI